MLRNLLYLAILTTIVVFSMIGFNIFHNYTTSTVSQDTGEAITPITPTFDRGALEALRQRKEVIGDLKKPVRRATSEGIFEFLPTTFPEPTTGEPGT